jgi:hypothetical protein
MIIEKYNSVLRGFVNFYYGFVNNPKYSLNRCVYIIRFSCLKTLAQKFKTLAQKFKTLAQKFKTLAQKFKTNIRGIFKRFGVKGPPNTVEIKIRKEVDGKFIQKSWKLLTLPILQEEAKAIKRFEKIEDTYWNVDKYKHFEYPTKRTVLGKVVCQIPTYSDVNFLDKIKWTHLRTTAQFENYSPI